MRAPLFAAAWGGGSAGGRWQYFASQQNILTFLKKMFALFYILTNNLHLSKIF